jgi:hypothetical protein
MANDPISSVLALMNATAVAAGGFTAAGRWALRFPPPEKLKFFVMARGNSVLMIDGISTPYLLQEGDTFLLQAGRAFVIGSDCETTPRNAWEVFDAKTPEVVDLGGSEILFLGGHINIDLAGSDMLMAFLPITIHLPAKRPESQKLAWLIDVFVREQIDAPMGAEQACAAIAQLIFLELLRGHVTNSPSDTSGWLRCLGDPQLVLALRVIHAEPEVDWSVEQLARQAGMSRSDGHGTACLSHRMADAVGPARPGNRCAHRDTCTHRGLRVRSGIQHCIQTGYGDRAHVLSAHCTERRKKKRGRLSIRCVINAGYRHPPSLTDISNDHPSSTDRIRLLCCYYHRACHSRN